MALPTLMVFKAEPIPRPGLIRAVRAESTTNSFLLWPYLNRVRDPSWDNLQLSVCYKLLILFFYLARISQICSNSGSCDLIRRVHGSKRDRWKSASSHSASPPALHRTGHVIPVLARLATFTLLIHSASWSGTKWSNLKFCLKTNGIYISFRLVRPSI